MAMAQVQQVIAAPALHDKACLKEEDANRETIQADTPCIEVEELEQAHHVEVSNNGGSTDEGVIPAMGTDDQNQGVVKELEAKLSTEHCPVEAEAKEPKEDRRLRSGKKAEKAAAKGAVVPVDFDTYDDEVTATGVANKTEKSAAKGAVVPVDFETDNDEVAPTGVANKIKKVVTKGVVVPVNFETDDEVAPIGVANKTEKAAPKGAVVPVNFETNDDEVAAAAVVAKKTEKTAAKGAVVLVDNEVFTLANQAPATASVALDQKAYEEATEGDHAPQDVCEKKARG